MRPEDFQRIRDTPGASLPPDYAFAADAVRAAGYRETGDTYDWVPVSVLYAAYHARWIKRKAPLPDGYDVLLLSKQDFGIALSLAFPGCEKCKRWIKGKKAGLAWTGRQVRGRCGLSGDDGLRTDDTRY